MKSKTSKLPQQTYGKQGGFSKGQPGPPKRVSTAKGGRLPGNPSGTGAGKGRVSSRPR